MKPMNLVKTLKSHKSGWVAIDIKSLKVIAKDKKFSSISKKVESRKDTFLMPAAKNYFGFIT